MVELNSTGVEDETAFDLFRSWEELTSSILSYHSRSLRLEHLRLPGFFLIDYIYRNGPQNLSELASAAQVSKPTVTNIVTILEEKSLVTRTRDAKDRRKFDVSLTDTAKGMVERIYLDRKEVDRELRKVMSTDQLREFSEYIRVFLNIVGKASEKKFEKRKEGD